MRSRFFAACDADGPRGTAAEHFEQALKETRASVTSEMEREYKEMLQSLEREEPQRIPIGFGPTA